MKHFFLFRDCFDEEVGSDVVDIRNEDAGIFWNVIGGVQVVGHLFRPMNPVT